MNNPHTLFEQLHGRRKGRDALEETRSLTSWIVNNETGAASADKQRQRAGIYTFGVPLSADAGPFEDVSTEVRNLSHEGRAEAIA